MTEPTTSEPTPAAEPEQPAAPRPLSVWDRLRIYWPNVLTVAVLLGVMFVTYHYTNQRREYVECHTEAMDALHHALYVALRDTPEDPESWAPKWAAAFVLWQEQIERCPHVE